MLILTRKVNEEIKIGPEITVKLLSISEGQIKLGITAPANVEIVGITHQGCHGRRINLLANANHINGNTTRSPDVVEVDTGSHRCD